MSERGALPGLHGRLQAIRHRSSPRQAATPTGVNVVGYLGVTSGLGERARVLVDALRAAGVAVSTWDVASTVSPPLHAADRGARAETPELHGITIAVVTALEFAGLTHSLPRLIEPGRHVIGYWFWELEDVPPSHDAALAMVDEVWAPTRFVRDAYASVDGPPVSLVPLPIPEPALPAGVPRSRPPVTFLVSFDHLSVMERKNPLGAVEAFMRAFPSGDEEVELVVKTINGERVPTAATELAQVIVVDERIRIRNEHLPEAAHLALIASADAFVSLHRSEGLGLHMAVAMWLGTPVIASAYSGSLDLMDDETAALVPVSAATVVDGSGAYPPGSRWAEPDLNVAAAAMRRMVDDPAWAAQLAAAARSRMLRQPSLVEAGEMLRRLLVASGADRTPATIDVRRRRTR